MGWLIIIFSSLFVLLLLFFLIHQLKFTDLTEKITRDKMTLAECVKQRQRIERYHTILSSLLVIFSFLALSFGYYSLCTGKTAVVTADKQETTTEATVEKKIVLSTTQSSTDTSSSESASKEREKKKAEEKKTSDSIKLAEEKVKKEEVEAKKKVDQDKKEEIEKEKKKAEEDKQIEAEMEAGDGLPIALEGSFMTDSEGVATVTGKAKNSIKKVSVTNSVTDDEEQIDVNSEGIFTFKFVMGNPMETTVIFVCDSNEAANLSEEDRQQAIITPDEDYLMTYQEEQNAKNQEEYE